MSTLVNKFVTCDADSCHVLLTAQQSKVSIASPVIPITLPHHWFWNSRRQKFEAQTPKLENSPKRKAERLKLFWPIENSDYPLGAARDGFYCGVVKPARAILLYFVFIIVGGALLAPWIYQLAQVLSGDVPALKNLASQPFHRYVNRSFLVLALAGLWLFLRSLGVRHWRDVGWARGTCCGRNLREGFATGFVSLCVIAGFALIFGARTLNLEHSAAEFGKHLGKVILTASVVAVMEETLFRGAVFGALRQAHHWVTALVVSSAIYALVHFFQRPASPAAVNWFSGLALLPLMAHGFVEFDRLVPGFFNLTLAGIILGVAYQRTGSLHFSIGLHGGWIFWLKSYAFLTREAADANTWLWGTGKMIDGWLALVVLTLTLVMVLWRLREPNLPPA